MSNRGEKWHHVEQLLRDTLTYLHALSCGEQNRAGYDLYQNLIKTVSTSTKWKQNYGI